MTIQFNFAVVAASMETRTMEVRYDAPGCQTVLIGMPLPSVGQDVVDVVSAYAPIAAWQEAERLVQLVEVGMSGAVDIADAPAPAAPRILTPRQIRLALSQMGYREQVEAAVAAGPLALQDAWSHALEFVRDDPGVLQMLAAVGATPEQADQLWALGATL